MEERFGRGTVKVLPVWMRQKAGQGTEAVKKSVGIDLRNSQGPEQSEGFARDINQFNGLFMSNEAEKGNKDRGNWQAIEQRQEP